MRLARWFGIFASRLIPIRRRQILENLSIAFPEWTDAQRAKLLRPTYTHMAALALETIAMDSMTPQDVIEAFETPFEGQEHFDRVRSSAKGFIIVTAHMGNWEWSGAFMPAIGIDVMASSKPQHNPLVERVLRSRRMRFGLKLAWTRKSPRKLIEHLKSGGVVAIMGDQDARHRGIFVRFFGREASTAGGPAWLAYRHDVPIVPMWANRTPEGKMRAFVDEPIWADRSAPIRDEIVRLTQYHVDSLERYVRRDPGQYFWAHRRWKTKPQEQDSESQPADRPASSPA